MLPYVIAFGNIPKFFEEITKASVPPKITTEYIYTILGLKSTSYRAMIPLLKKLFFIDEASIPTTHYKNYRDVSKGKTVMASRIKSAHSGLYASNEYAHKLDKNELKSKIKTLTGLADSNKSVGYMVGTFIELCKLADFEGKEPVEIKKIETEQKPKEDGIKEVATKLGISYTINLNLPPTTEIEVFNAIFKSLKENILNEN